MNRARRAARRVFRTRIMVAPFLGETGTGPSWADPSPVMASVAHKVRVVRDRQGVEVVSSSTVFCDPVKEALFAPESKVTLPGNRTAQVIDVAVHRDHRGRDTIVEAVLT